jgi:hypothetical protein
MKRRRPLSLTAREQHDEKRFRGPSKEELVASHAARVFATMHRVTHTETRPYYAPMNLVTGVYYREHDEGALLSVTPPGVYPLYCTAQQAVYKLDTRVLPRQLPLGRVSVPGRDGERMQWMPVFCVSQLEPSAAIEVRVRAYEMRMCLALAPAWMNNLKPLVEWRAARSAAPVLPLVALAAHATPREEGALAQAEALLKRLRARDPAITPPLLPGVDQPVWDAGRLRSVEAVAYYADTFYTLALLALAPHYTNARELTFAAALGLLTLLSEAGLDATTAALPPGLASHGLQMTEVRLLAVLQREGAVPLRIVNP